MFGDSLFVLLFAICNTLVGDEVRMLTHTYPYKHLSEIKWPSAITRLTVDLMCGFMFDLMICKQ